VLMGWELGSMLQGMPLQLPLGQSILRPKFGGLDARPDPIHSGFQAIFRKVSPLLTVLAPATKGVQLPKGWLDVPHLHPRLPGVPGPLI
jgi:hypothetical protein